jgi:hypothetical protein
MMLFPSSPSAGRPRRNAVFDFSMHEESISVVFWFREGYSWRRDPQPRLEITGHYEDGQLNFEVWVTE